MRKTEKALLSVLVVGVLSGLTTLGVFGVFTATTQNAGNEISTGTVAFSDNDAGSALYNVTGAKPGETVSKCIKTTYTGSLPSVVRLYTTSTPGSLAQYVNVKITQGNITGGATFPSCTGFAADTTNSGVVFNGTLQQFEQANNSYANGLVTAPEGQSTWAPGSSLVYKIDATLDAATPESGQGSTSGVHGFVWEARNN